MNDNVPDLGLAHLVLFIILTFASARLTRLAFKDEIFKEWRQALVDALMDESYERKTKSGKKSVHMRRKSSYLLRSKLAKLIVCPYCVSAYITAGVLLAHRWIVEPLPMPVWWWFGVWMSSIVVLEYTDGDGGAARKK